MKKVILIILGIVILLFVGCTALLVGGGTETLEEMEEDLNAEVGAEVEGETSEVATEEDTEEATEVEETTQLGVGDSYTIDGVTVTVNSVGYTDERNEFHETPVDSVLLVNVTYENNTGEDIAVGMDFQLYADGAQMETYPVDSLLGSVSDGRTVTGDVAYGVVGTPSSLELEFEPMLSFSGDKGIFNVTP